jgi:Polyketide cyclase / dehydrase and lipid transport
LVGYYEEHTLRKSFNAFIVICNDFVWSIFMFFLQDSVSQFKLRLAAMLATASVVLGLSACSAAPPAQAPAMPEPPAVINDDAYVTHVAQRTVQWDRVAFRQWLEKEQLVSFFPKDMGIPGVKGTTPMRGTWGQNGAIRRVELDDGHYAFDLILNNRYPDVFAYQVFGFTSQAGRVADYIRAELRYTELSPGVTQLQWTYAMRPKSALTKPLVSQFMTSRIQPYMEAGMDNMAKAAAVAARRAKVVQQ